MLCNYSALAPPFLVPDVLDRRPCLRRGKCDGGRRPRNIRLAAGGEEDSPREMTNIFALRLRPSLPLVFSRCTKSFGEPPTLAVPICFCLRPAAPREDPPPPPPPVWGGGTRRQPGDRLRSADPASGSAPPNFALPRRAGSPKQSCTNSGCLRLSMRTVFRCQAGCGSNSEVGPGAGAE